MAPTKKELMLAMLVLLLTPALLEIALRTAGVEFDAQLYSPSQKVGWALRPGAEGLVSVETKQYVKINSHGFHDVERAYEKPANTFRIAVLGNSWTEALQVPLEKTYCTVLEKKLAKISCYGEKQVEVLNFGVAGYSTAQELLTLQERVWRYNPDLVILAFYPARDIANNVRELNNAVDPERSPYFVYSEGKLVLDDSFRRLPVLQPRQIALQDLGYVISRRPRVLQAVSAMQRMAKIRVAMAAEKNKANESGAEKLEYSNYKAPIVPAMQMGWKVTEDLLLAMRDEVKEHRAEFRVVILATRPQVIPDLQKREELAQRAGVKDFAYADERLNEFGRRAGITMTTLAPPLSSYAEAHQVYLNGFHSSNLGTGHWNETGHRIVAETIAGDLCGESTKNDPAAKAAKQ